MKLKLFFYFVKNRWWIFRNRNGFKKWGWGIIVEKAFKVSSEKTLNLKFQFSNSLISIFNFFIEGHPCFSPLG